MTQITIRIKVRVKTKKEMDEIKINWSDYILMYSGKARTAR